jgi:NADPH:quinone reductase-like Zn-dependent oxidoreductase
VGGTAANLLQPAHKQHSPGAGDDQLCYLAAGAGDAHRGGLGESGCLAAVPARVSDVQAAALPAAGLTALRALAIGGLVLASRVLVTGAAGGVERMAVQLTHASGADVTALVRDAAASGELMGSLGAAAVIEDLGGEFDVIIDGVGGATSGLAIEHLRPRGRREHRDAGRRGNGQLPGRALRPCTRRDDLHA